MNFGVSFFTFVFALLPFFLSLSFRLTRSGTKKVGDVPKRVYALYASWEGEIQVKRTRPCVPFGTDTQAPTC